MGQILLDHQRFVGLFQQHLPLSSGAVPRNEALNDQPPMPPPSGAVPRNEAPNDQPPMPPPSGALLTAEAPSTTEISYKQPL